MKTRSCMLEFTVFRLADIRLLYKAWDRLWTTEDQRNTDSVMVYITVDDRLPGEAVSLNFNATPDILDKFLSILEQVGLRFICEELVHSPGGLGAIGANAGHDPGNGPEG